MIPQNVRELFVFDGMDPFQQQQLYNFICSEIGSIKAEKLDRFSTLYIRKLKWKWIRIRSTDPVGKRSLFKVRKRKNQIKKEKNTSPEEEVQCVL